MCVRKRQKREPARGPTHIMAHWRLNLSLADSATRLRILAALGFLIFFFALSHLSRQHRLSKSPTPTRTLHLINPDRELYQKNHSLMQATTAFYIRVTVVCVRERARASERERERRGAANVWLIGDVCIWRTQPLALEFWQPLDS